MYFSDRAAGHALHGYRAVTGHRIRSRRRGCRCGRPEHPDPALPLSRPTRNHQNRRAVRHGDEKAQRARPKTDRSARRLQYLRFTQDWRILPDNNDSERDIRMIKLRQKVAGFLRALTEPHSSAPYAATHPPPPNTASASSTPSSCSSKADPGCPQFNDLTRYTRTLVGQISMSRSYGLSPDFEGEYDHRQRRVTESLHSE
ncbi:MAG: IS66 family transposase [Pseudonocardiaceae bacterium]